MQTSRGFLTSAVEKTKTQEKKTQPLGSNFSLLQILKKITSNFESFEKHFSINLDLEPKTFGVRLYAIFIYKYFQNQYILREN